MKQTVRIALKNVKTFSRRISRSGLDVGMSVTFTSPRAIRSATSAVVNPVLLTLQAVSV
jgi:hypothetical protein